MNHEMYQDFLKKSKSNEDKLFWKNEYLKELQEKQKRAELAIRQQEYNIETAKKNIKRFRYDLKQRAKTIRTVTKVEFD